MNKTDVTFPSAGLRLAGHLYMPDGEAGGRRPAAKARSDGTAGSPSGLPLTRRKTHLLCPFSQRRHRGGARAALRARSAMYIHLAVGAQAERRTLLREGSAWRWIPLWPIGSRRRYPNAVACWSITGWLWQRVRLGLGQEGRLPLRPAMAEQ